MTPLSVVCWKWKAPPGYRSTFLPPTVNTLRRMVARHYPHPHRFICCTDDPAGIDPDIEIVPLWDEFARVLSPHGGKNPSCYRRLRLFDPAIASVLGERFVSLDLDAVIVGDLTPLWHRTEDFVIWGDTHPTTAYNGSMMLLTAGARPQVWESFDPATSPTRAKQARCFGSDQGWISYCLGPNEAKWSKDDGVYSYRNDSLAVEPLPINARIVLFHGRHDPWGIEPQQLDWVRAHYQ